MRLSLVLGVPLVPLLSLAPSTFAPADLATESAVFAAVFRQQIQEHLDAATRDAGMVICLAVNPGGAPQTPSPDLMRPFASDRAVRRAAECDARPQGAVEAMTLRPAIIVTAGPIDWVAGDEAWVVVSYFRTARLSAERRYRVVREQAGWVSLGPIVVGTPI